MLHSGRYFFHKTVMGNRLSSDTWLRESDDVIEGLEGVYKLVDDLTLMAHCMLATAFFWNSYCAQQQHCHFAFCKFCNRLVSVPILLNIT